jgi:2,4-diketo-3-deoxy-L-fuconate hydrolase
MKIGTILTGGVQRVACLFADPATAVLASRDMGDVVDIIQAGGDAVERLRALATDAGAERVALSTVKVLAPIQRFTRDVLCTGWNYWDHFYESEGKREGQDVPKPDAPTFFTKAPGVVIGPDDDIAFDASISAKWDYEAEIVLVIGKGGRSIPREKAMSHIFGYCLANDVSQRDLQRRHGGQWLKGKSIDGTMPLGPWIVLRDDVDLQATTIEFELNGRLLQQASASQMAFAVDELVSELSRGMTLHAGDILLTGTPSGIGNARTPPVFLKEGDDLRVRATGLGELHNRMRKTDLAGYQPL